MTTINNRLPNQFCKVSDTGYIGSYISMAVEFHHVELTFSHRSRNGNEVWQMLTPSPRTGVLFPIGTATLMQPEAEGEGPYFLGRIEDPSGLNIPFKIVPIDAGDPASPWLIRYNPQGSAGSNPHAQPGGFQRPQQRGFGAQRRSTALGPSLGAGGMPQTPLGAAMAHGFIEPAPGGFMSQEGEDAPAS